MVLTRQSTRLSSAAFQIQAITSTVQSSTASAYKPPKKRAKVTIDESQETPSSSKPKRPRKLKSEVDKSEFLPRVQSQWKVGAHVSAAGGVENAIINAASIGANSFALFLKSQRKWESPPLNNESITEFKRLMKEYGYESRMVLPHGSYLINLGNPDVAKREKSFACFLDDLKRCEALGLDLYNFHPGSTVGETSVETSLSLIADCINRAHVETRRVTVVLENMAGAGNIIGSDFSDLAGIIKLVNDKSRVGVCLDTCHAFAAGYDIRTKDGWNSTLTKFDEQVGLKYLCGMHLNDSKAEYNSKKDRHENIGLGHLGLLSFVHILNDQRTQNIPLILETPSFEQAKEVWGTEISILQRVSGTGDVQRPDGTANGMDPIINVDAFVNQLKKSVLKGAENGKKPAKLKATMTPTRIKGKKATKRKRCSPDNEDADTLTHSEDEERRVMWQVTLSPT